ncbi:hypothetical protein FB567DRAFT_227915 [Paraphoma chrysanthemicola]|uniref:Uncharacterized protein n=1 Tax=Paraphoma chrysanthemicola TaxID=798071 RepID=A0A8K0RF91_9PLEO|nr:hypothetical protein FB567DRAFT_227915 [Paraphoma chrysanthemicola]
MGKVRHLVRSLRLRIACGMSKSSASSSASTPSTVSSHQSSAVEKMAHTTSSSFISHTPQSSTYGHCSIQETPLKAAASVGESSPEGIVIAAQKGFIEAEKDAIIEQDVLPQVELVASHDMPPEDDRGGPVQLEFNPDSKPSGGSSSALRWSFACKSARRSEREHEETCTPLEWRHSQQAFLNDADFDALPEWSDVEDDPGYNAPHVRDTDVWSVTSRASSMAVADETMSDAGGRRGWENERCWLGCEAGVSSGSLH